jgi:hypothetical protein
MQATNVNVLETVKNRFAFEVQKFPLSGPDNMRTEWHGLFRNDNLKPVGSGSVTSRYVPHTTDDILALVEAAGSSFEGGIGNVSCYFNDGHYVAVEPTKDFRVSIFGTNDNIFPRIVINAGYDGRAFKATMGYYRDTCKNMARMNCVANSSVSIRHTSGLRNSWSAVVSRAQSMQAEQVQMADFLREVYGEPEADTGRGATIHRNRTEAIFNRLLNERRATGRGNVGRDWLVSKWEAFNAVQGYVQHEATRKGADRENNFSRIVMAMNDPAVIRAEEYLALAA